MATTSAKKLVALIVDDDSVNRAVAMKCLDRLGFDQIKIAENGQEAVDFFHEGNQFDVIIMDMEMPIMDGSQATRAIRVMGVKSLIIGMSTSSSQAKIQDFVNAGLDEFLAKPLNLDKLQLIMSRLIS